MVRRQQLRQRVGHKSRIAEIGVAIEIGVSHRLGHHVHGLGGMKAQRPHVVALENVQDLAQRDTAGGGRRRGKENIATIVAGQWRRLCNAVRGEVGRGDDPIAGAGCRLDGVRNAATIERLWPIRGDRCEGCRQPGLHQTLARFQGRSVRMQEDACGAHVAA